MDNRSHEETGWDPDLLKFEIGELDVPDFDLQFTGFDAREIDEFRINAADDEAANQVPLPPTIPVSRLSDLWWCGVHRVLHGDATNNDDVARARGELTAAANGNRSALRGRAESDLARGSWTRISGTDRHESQMMTAWIGALRIGYSRAT